MSEGSKVSARLLRLSLAAVILAGLAALLVWALRPRPIAVEAAVVERGVMTVEISEEAETRVREVYVVSAPTAGRLERVVAEPGDPVVGGETVLARLTPAEPPFLDSRTRADRTSAITAAEAARDAAQAAVRQTEAQLDVAQADFERVQPLVARGTVARARLDQAVAARDAARAAWDGARESLRAREADLTRARAALIAPSEPGADASNAVDLHAPVDGAVLTVRLESETVVPAGAAIVEIGDPRDLEIVAELLSSDAVQIAVGAPVRIDGWGGAELAGRVARIEPAAFTKVSALGIEEQRVNVIIDIESPREAWSALAHRYRADVHIEAWRGEDVTIAPAAALFRQGADWAVFVIEPDGRARLTPVTVGRLTARRTEITGGVEAGASVVLHPPDRVDDGARVLTQSREPNGATSAVRQ